MKNVFAFLFLLHFNIAANAQLICWQEISTGSYFSVAQKLDGTFGPGAKIRPGSWATVRTSIEIRRYK